MTHPRRYVAGFAVLAVAFLAAGCGGITRPQGWATPAFDDSTAFVFLDKDRLSALDISADGPASVLWELPAEGASATEDIDIEAAYGSPVVEDGRLYFTAHEGDALAINIDSGLPSWRYDDVDGNITDGPAVADGFLAFGTSEGRLYVLNLEDGTPAPGWEDGKDVGQPIWATPVIRNGVIYTATMKGSVYAYNIDDGSEAWAEHFEADGAVPALGMAGDDTLFVPSFDKHVYLLDAATGQPRFEDAFVTDGWVWTIPAMDGDIAYFGDLDGNVYSLDITTNEAVWASTYDAGNKVKASAVVMEDTLIVADHTPEIHFLSLADGSVQGTFLLPEASTVRANLVLHDGDVYAITTKGELFRIDPETRTAAEITVAGQQ